jgi:hypothetical protein
MLDEGIWVERMGAWGTGVFENDTACDFASAVADGGGMAALVEALDRVAVSGDNYLEAPDATSPFQNPVSFRAQNFTSRPFAVGHRFHRIASVNDDEQMHLIVVAAASSPIVAKMGSVCSRCREEHADYGRQIQLAAVQRHRNGNFTELSFLTERL